MSTIILTLNASTETLRAKSLRNDALNVAANRPWVARNGVVAIMPAQHRHLLIAMLSRGSCTMSDLVDALYRDDPSGGPDAPSTVINQRKYDLLSISAALGLHIGRAGRLHIAEFAE